MHTHYAMHTLNLLHTMLHDLLLRNSNMQQLSQTPSSVVCVHLLFFCNQENMLPFAGNTKGGSITVLLIGFY
jgi:hypothetical protein